MNLNLVTIPEAAQVAGLSTRTIHTMCTDGRLTRYRLEGGRATRVDLDQLMALFQPEGA